MERQMLDEAVGCVLTFLGIMFATVALLSGLWWLLVHGWPYLLLVGLVALTVLIVRAYRRQSLAYQRRQVDMKVGLAKRELDDAYQQVMVEMDHAAREWNQLS
jgi:hypothetical protein